MNKALKKRIYKKRYLKKIFTKKRYQTKESLLKKIVHSKGKFTIKEMLVKAYAWLKICYNYMIPGICFFVLCFVLNCGLGGGICGMKTFPNNRQSQNTNELSVLLIREAIT